MSANQTILIVDDDKNLSDSIKRALEKAGYSVAQSFSINECRQYLKTNLPDLLLMDVILGDGNGIEFSNELSNHPVYFSIGTLLMSGLKTNELDRQLRLSVGAIDYVTKPIQLSNLLQRVNLIFSVQKLERKQLSTEKKFDNVFANVSDLAFILDAEGRIVNLSKSFERITNFEIENWLKRTFRDIVFEKDKPNWDNCILLVKGERTLPSFELFISKKEGTLVPLLVTLSKINSDNDLESGIVGIAKDLTALKFIESSSSDMETAQGDSQKREINSWEMLSSSTTNLTQTAYEVAVFSSKNQEVFLNLLAEYSQLIEKSIESRIYKVEYNEVLIRKDFANRLGFLKAGPRDLVRIHTEFFKQMDKNVHPKRLALYHEEARLALLEIMGYLVSYYRNRGAK